MNPVVFFLLANALLQLGALACFIALVVEMFRHGESGWGIACLVLVLCGCGQLVALVYGWTKAGEWDIGLLMLASTLCMVAAIIQSGLWMAKFGPTLGL